MQVAIKRIVAFAIPGVSQFLSQRFSTGIDFLLSFAILALPILLDVHPLTNISLFLLPPLWCYNAWDIACHLQKETRKIFLRRLLLVLVCLGGFVELAMWMFVQNHRKKKHSIDEAQIIEITRVVNVDKEEKDKEQTVQNSTKFLQVQNELNQQTKIGNKNDNLSDVYDLVIGAFLSLERAKAVKEKLVPVIRQNQNMMIRSIQRKKLWHEIHLVGYKTTDEAKIALRQLLSDHPSIKQDRPYIMRSSKP